MVSSIIESISAASIRIPRCNDLRHELVTSGRRGRGSGHRGAWRASSDGHRAAKPNARETPERSDLAGIGFDLPRGPKSRDPASPAFYETPCWRRLPPPSRGQNAGR